MSIPIYPASLIGPATGPVTPAERRFKSVGIGPMALRPAQLDYLGTQQLQWAVLTPEQAEIFYEWWRDDLRYGGGWFRAYWPFTLSSKIIDRKFTTELSWRHIPGGNWSVSANVAIRAGSEDPKTIFIYDHTGDSQWHTVPHSYSEAMMWMWGSGGQGGNLDHGGGGGGFSIALIPVVAGEILEVIVGGPRSLWGGPTAVGRGGARTGFGGDGGGRSAIRRALVSLIVAGGGGGGGASDGHRTASSGGAGAGAVGQNGGDGQANEAWGYGGRDDVGGAGGYVGIGGGGGSSAETGDLGQGGNSVKWSARPVDLCELFPFWAGGGGGGGGYYGGGGGGDQGCQIGGGGGGGSGYVPIGGTTTRGDLEVPGDSGGADYYNGNGVGGGGNGGRDGVGDEGTPGRVVIRYA